MKYLVTGGGGFLGGHIIQQLLERGDAVCTFSRKEYPELTKVGVESFQGDLTDKDAIYQACKEVDGVFHVASLTGVSGKYEDYYNVNVLGTENVISACKKAGISRLVYTSTPSVVYGRNEIINGDESLPYPEKFLTYYAQTKANAEKIILSSNAKDNLYTCSLRPHLIFGPGDTNLIPRIIERANSGKLMQVGDGTNEVSVSYVENTASAHLAAMDRLNADSPVAGSAYFINEEKPVNCWDFINTIISQAGAKPLTKKIPFNLAYCLGAVLEIAGLLNRKWEPPMTRFLALQLATSHWFNISKAKKDLNWQPEISIEDGLKKMFTK